MQQNVLFGTHCAPTTMATGGIGASIMCWCSQGLNVHLAHTFGGHIFMHTFWDAAHPTTNLDSSLLFDLRIRLLRNPSIV